MFILIRIKILQWTTTRHWTRSHRTKLDKVATQQRLWVACWTLLWKCFLWLFKNFFAKSLTRNYKAVLTLGSHRYCNRIKEKTTCAWGVPETIWFDESCWKFVQKRYTTCNWTRKVKTYILPFFYQKWGLAYWVSCLRIC